MRVQKPLISAVLAAAAAAALSFAGTAAAETVAVDGAVAVKKTDVSAPTRGMTMDSVVKRFGDPVNKLPAVGKPPITRWQYPGYVVYFEYKYVIDSVVAG